MQQNNGSTDKGGGGFFAGFVVGAIVGAALAMMLAPQTGEETRDIVFGKAREAANFAKDASGDLRDRVSNVASDLQANAAGFYQRGRSVVDSARSQMDAASDEARSAAETTRDELSAQATESSREPA